MAIQRRELPYIPKEVDLSVLASNGKLYADDRLVVLKKILSKPGRYVSFIDDSGREQNLKFTVFNFNQQLLAIHPRPKSVLRFIPHGTEKLAQDLQTGEWVAQRVVTIQEDNRDTVTAEQIDNEIDLLKKFNLLHAGARLEPFFVPSQTLDLANEMEEFPQEIHQEDGDYYYFTKLDAGLTLQQLMTHQPALPAMVKLNIAMGAVRALQRLHEEGIYHCNVNLSQLKFDFAKPRADAVTLVDFDNAVYAEEAKMWRAGRGAFGFEAPEVRSNAGRLYGEYSEESDTYALGVTLGLFLDVLKLRQSESTVDMIDSEFANERDIYEDLEYIDVEKSRLPEALHSNLLRLIFAMKHQDAEERPPLQEVSDSLNKIRHKLSNEHRQLKICVLDIHTLHAAHERGAQAAIEFMRGLKEFDKIRLYDSTSVCSDNVILLAKNQLENSGLLVECHVLLGSPQQMRKMIAEQSVKPDADDLQTRITYLGPQTPQEQIVAQPVMVTARPLEPLVRMEEPLIPAAEPYQWGECMSWFCTEISSDVGHAVDACDIPDPNSFHRFLSFFSCGSRPQPAAQNHAPLEQIVIIDDDAEDRANVVRGRY